MRCQNTYSEISPILRLISKRYHRDIGKLKQKYLSPIECAFIERRINHLRMQQRHKGNSESNLWVRYLLTNEPVSTSILVSSRKLALLNFAFEASFTVNVPLNSCTSIRKCDASHYVIGTRAWGIPASWIPCLSGLKDLVCRWHLLDMLVAFSSLTRYR